MCGKGAAALSPGAGSAGRRSARPVLAQPLLRLPQSHPGDTRGLRAHLIFLTDVDEGRDAHVEGPGTAVAPLAKPRRPERERQLAGVPHNRFRVTLRGGVIEIGGARGSIPRRAGDGAHAVGRVSRTLCTGPGADTTSRFQPLEWCRLFILRVNSLLAPYLTSSLKS